MDQKCQRESESLILICNIKSKFLHINTEKDDLIKCLWDNS